jgi:hypothetical protein
MGIVAAVVVVTLLCLVLASVCDGHRRTAVDGNDAWMLEQHTRLVRFRHEPSIPAGHPVTNLDLGERTQGRA